MNPYFTVIFEHEDFLIISKNPGISFHGEQGGTGLFSQVRQAYVNDELHPVHRLDKITSGLLIIAKHKHNAQLFSGMFQKGQVDKYYLAISDRKPSRKQGCICGDMCPSRRGTWKLLQSRKSPATTQFFSQALGNGQRLYLLKPHTGKTHQIRVALKSIGAPILGDPLYYKASCPSHDRAYLHAYALRFYWKDERIELLDRPAGGELFTTSSCLDLLRNQYALPWDLNWPNIART